MTTDSSPPAIPPVPVAERRSDPLSPVDSHRGKDRYDAIVNSHWSEDLYNAILEVRTLSKAVHGNY